MFLFAWYGVDVPAMPGISGLDAFDAFGDWFNIILVFAAFSGMALALFGSGVARSPVSLSVVDPVLGAISHAHPRHLPDQPARRSGPRRSGSRSSTRPRVRASSSA